MKKFFLMMIKSYVLERVRMALVDEGLKEEIVNGLMTVLERKLS